MIIPGLGYILVFKINPNGCTWKSHEVNGVWHLVGRGSAKFIVDLYVCIFTIYISIYIIPNK